MSGARGFEAKMGIGQEATWGDAVLVTEQVKFSSESVQESSEPLADDAITGRASRSFEREGPIRVGGQVQAKVRYPSVTVVDPSLLLKNHFGEQRGIIYRNIVNESWVGLRLAAADNVELSQQVVVPGAGAQPLFAVKVLLRRRGALATGNVFLEVQGDAAGSPDGVPILNGASALVPVNTITLANFGQWVEFTFATDPDPGGGTTVHYVLGGDYAVSATDNIEVGTEDVASLGGFEIFDVAWVDDPLKNMNLRTWSKSFSDNYFYSNNLTGKGLTRAVDKQDGGISEHTGLKLSNMVERGDPETGVVATFDVIGKEESAAPLNTVGILSGILNLNPPLGFTDLNFRIGDQVDALGVPDEFAITEFEFRSNWELDQINTSGGRNIIEPENTHRTVEFQFNLPRLESNAFQVFAKAGTRLQARLSFTDGVNFRTILIPEFVIQPTVDAQVTGPNPLTVTVRGRCYQNTQNNFMHVEDEAEIVLQNV